MPHRAPAHAEADATAQEPPDESNLDFEVLSKSQNRTCRAVGCKKQNQGDGFCRVHHNRYLVCTGQCGSWDCLCGEKVADFVSKCWKCRKFRGGKRSKKAESTDAEANSSLNDEGLAPEKKKRGRQKKLKGEALEERPSTGQCWECPCGEKVLNSLSRCGNCRKWRGGKRPKKAGSTGVEAKKLDAGGSVPEKKKRGRQKKLKGKAADEESEEAGAAKPESLGDEAATNGSGSPAAKSPPGRKQPPEIGPPNGSPQTQKTRKRQHDQPPNDVQLFNFDVAQEQFNWGRPKRRIKAICPFDPTYRKEKKSDYKCKIGEGFACPRCGTICTYDSRQCAGCQLDCCYEAGVGVVVVQQRRIDYTSLAKAKKRAASPEKMGAVSPGAEEGAGAMKMGDDAEGSAVESDNAKPSATNELGESSKISSQPVADGEDQSSFFSKDGDLSDKTKSVDSDPKEADEQQAEKVSKTAVDDAGPAPKKKRGRRKKSKRDACEQAMDEGGKDTTQRKRSSKASAAASKSSLKPPPGKSNDMKGATLELRDESTTSDITPTSDLDPQKLGTNQQPSAPPEAAAGPTKEPTMRFMQEMKTELHALGAKYDAIVPLANKAEKEFHETVIRLDMAVRELEAKRTNQKASFSKQLSSSSAGLAEIGRTVASVATERDEFRRKVEAEGLPAVPTFTPNYSTKIDSLQDRMSRLLKECTGAKNRVQELLGSTEEQQLESSQLVQRYREIEVLKRELSEFSHKIGAANTEQADLVRKISSMLEGKAALQQADKQQKERITELERENADKDSLINGLQSENADKDKTINELQSEIEKLKSRKKRKKRS